MIDLTYINNGWQFLFLLLLYLSVDRLLDIWQIESASFVLPTDDPQKFVKVRCMTQWVVYSTIIWALAAMHVVIGAIGFQAWLLGSLHCVFYYLVTTKRGE